MTALYLSAVPHASPTLQSLSKGATWVQIERVESPALPSVTVLSSLACDLRDGLETTVTAAEKLDALLQTLLGQARISEAPKVRSRRGCFRYFLTRR